jgi:hypothetical protein
MNTSNTPEQPRDVRRPDLAPAAAELSAAEQLDEDELGVDPLERDVGLPEQWAGAERYGVTPNEQRTGEPLDQQLPQEEPEVQPDEQRLAPPPDDTEWPR